jgi:hypothetical protein
MVLAAVASADTRSNAPDRARAFADTITRRYDVQLWTTGYTGLAKGPDCDKIANAASYDSLVGTVQGVEDTRGEFAPTYLGVLRRKTSMDYCLALEEAWCVTTLIGTARMAVTIEIQEDPGAGAHVAADSTGPPDVVTVTGGCERGEQDQIRADYPSGESGGHPGGQAIEETARNAFAVNGVRRLRVGVFPPNATEGGWGLRVTRVVP